MGEWNGTLEGGKAGDSDFTSCRLICFPLVVSVNVLHAQCF
jgi:hypothetical protein